MNLLEDEAKRRFRAARCARLATADPAGQPHLVPITFAADDDVVVTAIDHKPKSTGQLKRLSNIAHNPHVSLLADHYDDDWTQLWWVRADGSAEVLPPGADPVGRLIAKYPQYKARPPEGPVIRIEIGTWRGWSYA